MRLLISVLLLVAMLLLPVGDAEARRRSKAKPATPSETAAGARDSNMLCNGGMMITADDQIKGCTALISSGRQLREAKAVAFYNRGNAYVRKNDFGRAIADYGEALKLKTDYAQAFFNRAVAQRVSGNPQAAVADYTSSLNLSPNDADALAGRGSTYASLAMHDKAMQDFSRALTLKPGHLVALTQRGHANVRLQQWATAIADYDAAISISATNSEARYGLGVAKIYSGDIPGGQSDIAAAMAVDSGVTARMTTLGIPPPQIKTGQPPA